jgi:hypothetical protein
LKCQKCESERILFIDAKCSDLCQSVFKDISKEGYAPSVKNFGGGDYISIRACLACGQLQGEFPQPNPDFYEEAMEEMEDDFYLCENCQRSYAASDLNNSGLCQRCR